MSKITTALRLLKTPSKMLIPMADNGFFNWLPDKQYLLLAYRCHMGTALNLKNPKTFNEKLQWLKLYNRKSLYTTLVNKVTVKDYVSSIIGQQYIIPTLMIWDKPEDIELSKLPNKFVLKCTHDSGSVIICRDKSQFNIEDAKRALKKSLKRNIYWFGREWPYKNIKPQIIAEPYLEDSNLKELRDYKFFCFGGVVKCFKVDFDRFINHRANYYDGSRLLKIGEKICPPDFNKKIVFPDNLDLMKKIAEQLSANIPFVRVDLYNVDGKIYFSELTFYPASGFGEFIYKDNDRVLGSWIDLPRITPS